MSNDEPSLIKMAVELRLKTIANTERGKLCFNGAKFSDNDLKIELHGKAQQWTVENQGDGSVHIFLDAALCTGKDFTSHGRGKKHYLGVSEGDGHKLFACWDADLGYDKYRWTLQGDQGWVNKKYPQLKDDDDQICMIAESC